MKHFTLTFILLQNEGLTRTERKILQLDRFSLVAVPVLYAVAVAIFVTFGKN